MALNKVSASPLNALYGVSAPAVNGAAGESEEQEKEALTTAKNQPAATFERRTVDPEYQSRPELVAQLKAEQAANQERFLNTIREMLGQQGKQVAIGEGIWEQIAKGDYEVTPEAQAEAQKNIAEDGYWGVEKTSDRIVQFATALTGGDPSKLDAMIEAFEQGYKEAEKAWGGALPEISQRTREAVLQKFENLKNGKAITG